MHAISNTIMSARSLKIASILFAAFFSSFVLAGGPTQPQDPVPPSDPAQPPEASPPSDPANWMANVDPTNYLSDLSIPGTHDSGAIHDFFDTGTAKAQSLTIPEQLEIGVRYLDIRFKIVSPAGFSWRDFLPSGRPFSPYPYRRSMQKHLGVFHGPIDQELSGSELMSECTQFLQTHPKETIIMAIKEEGGLPWEHPHPYQFEQMVHDLIVQFGGQERFWTEPNTPTLSEAQGKIVVVRRFSHNNPRPEEHVDGINADVWGQPGYDNNEFTYGNLDVEDYYKFFCANIFDDPSIEPEQLCQLAVDEKWNHVTSHLEKAKKDYLRNGILYITLTSATEFAADTFPYNRMPIDGAIKRFSDPIDGWLIEYMTSNSPGRYGIVAVDFVNKDVSKSIFSSNF